MERIKRHARKGLSFRLVQKVNLLKFCDQNKYILIYKSLVRGRQLSMMTVNLYKYIHLHEYDKVPARKYIYACFDELLTEQYLFSVD